jgi:hypothetical protein
MGKVPDRLFLDSEEMAPHHLPHVTEERSHQALTSTP